MSDEQKLSLGYQEALNQLRQHPTLIWTRSNFFLLIQAGLLAFTLNLPRYSGLLERGIACTAGFLLALIWFWVNWAGRQLQRTWRDIVVEFEAEIFQQAGAGKEIAGPFHRAKQKGEGQHKSVSITLMLMLLAAGFAIIWALIFLLILLGKF